MAKEAVMNVYLLGATTDPEQIVGVAIRRCYSNLPAADLIKKISPQKRRELIEMVESVGHTSTTEHAGFNFAVEGISRAAAQQLTRHRLASYSMLSMRYVDLSREELQIIVPEAVRRNPEALKLYMKSANQAEETYRELLRLGMKAEDARGRLGLDTECKLVFTMNARELGGPFFTERLCRRAQAEIRDMAIGMAKLVRREAPTLFGNIGPSCKREGICWEGDKSCGLWRRIEGAELRRRERHWFKEGVENDLSFLDEKND